MELFTHYSPHVYCLLSPHFSHYRNASAVILPYNGVVKDVASAKHAALLKTKRENTIFLFNQSQTKATGLMWLYVNILKVVKH